MPRANALHIEPHLVIEVIRQRQDDLLPRLGQRQRGQAIGLIAAGGDQDILRPHGAAIGARHIGRQGVPQLGQAFDIGIARGCRLADDRGKMIGQGSGWRIAGDRLADIDQRLAGRKATVLDPAMGFGDRWWRDAFQQRIDAIAKT